MNDYTLNSTSNMVSAAFHVANIIESKGMTGLRYVDGWKAVNYSACEHANGWASIVVPGTKAVAEIIIENNEAGLSCIVRAYPDGTRRTTWAIGSEMNVGIDRAMAHLTNHYCQKAAEAEAKLEAEVEAAVPAAETTYEQWDAQRRELYDAFDPDYDHVDVVHNEYESCVYFGNTGGRVVASWYCSTGTCNVQTIEQLADALAADVRNYIINAHHDGAKS